MRFNRLADCRLALTHRGFALVEDDVDLKIMDDKGKCLYHTIYEYEAIEATEMLLTNGRILPHKIGNMPKEQVQC